MKATEAPLRARRKLAVALLEELPNVKCVFEQQGGIEGEYRLRRLRHLAGERRTLTVHRENGCSFRVDVARCYFSPRLSTERLRIANKVDGGEHVLNMFAGVGPFSIPIAKKTGARVTSCELNRYACALHEENNRNNGVVGLVRVLNSDAADLPNLVGQRFDRILMPHPSASRKYLPQALALVKKRGVVHYYRHVLGRDEGEAQRNLRKELAQHLPRGATWKLRRVREIGPRWMELAADVTLAD